MRVNGQAVGLARPDEAIPEVSSMGSEEERDAAREMLKEEKMHTYVPSSKELDRMIAIMDEFVRRKEYGN